MRPGVFLDRDDTLIRCRELPAPAAPARPGDLVDPALVELLPGVGEACAALKRAGFTLVVVSNQGVVARGGLGLAGVETIHDRVRSLVGARTIDAFYYCPYHPEAPPGRFSREHPWRKPAGGMVWAAARELGIDPASSWLVGDGERDAEAGVAGGIARERCLRVGPGADLPDLAAALGRILAPRQQPAL
ncbi:MAG: HAD-IIIA family hydrolase [Phycisphaerae bacterium]|nr:HAD-IIIA family hydrolase [Phycisphaerae bacterium]